MPTTPFRKTYLSLSLSRALAAEFPIGDPYGGPAYGERNAPAVVAVVAFVAANAGTIAMIGLALNVAGAITGNKTLSTIGTVMSVVGGGFSLAQQGAFDFIDAGIKEWAVSAANGFQTTAEAISAASTGGLDTIGTTTGAETGIEASAGSTAGTELNLAAAPGAAEAPTGLINAPAVGTGETGAAEVSAAEFEAGMQPANLAADGEAIADAGIAPAAPEAASPVTEATGSSAISEHAADVALNGARDMTSVSDNILSGIGTWIEKNKGLTELGLKFGQGLLAEDDSADKDALARAYDARTAETQRQAANASAVPDITKMFRANPQAKIARAAPVYAPGFRPGGLIQAR